MATIKKRGDKYRVRYDVYENGTRKQRNKSFSRAKEAKHSLQKLSMRFKQVHMQMPESSL